MQKCWKLGAFLFLSFIVLQLACVCPFYSLFWLV